MSLTTHNRLILWGFCLGYTAVMGSLLLAGVSVAPSIRSVLFAVLAVLGVVSITLVGFAKFSRITAD